MDGIHIEAKHIVTYIGSDGFVDGMDVVMRCFDISVLVFDVCKAFRVRLCVLACVCVCVFVGAGSAEQSIA